MLIVYAAVAGQSIVKLYAAAMLPGFFLTFLYLVYILGWAIINPKMAPKLPPDQYRVAVPAFLRALERGPSRSVVPGLLAALVRPPLARGWAIATLLQSVGVVSVPLMLTVGLFAAAWWYVVIHNAPEVVAASGALAPAAPITAPAPPAPAAAARPPRKKSRRSWVAGPPGDPEKPQELGAAAESAMHAGTKTEGPPEEMSSLRSSTAAPGVGKIPAHFYAWFWGLAAASTLVLLYYFWHMDGEQLQILKDAHRLRGARSACSPSSCWR